MRIKFILVTIFTMSLTLFANIQTTDFEEAKKLSIQHNRPILIDFMTDW